MSGKKFHVSFLVMVLAILVLLFNLDPDFAGYAAAAEKNAVVTTNGVNVRSGPGTGFAAVGMVNKGDSFQVLEESKGWASLKNSSRVHGWVKELYLMVTEKRGQQANSGTVSNPGMEQPSGNGKTIVVTADNVNLRSGPGTKFTIVGNANKGQQFAVSKESAGWYCINIGQGKPAWIIARFASVKPTKPAAAGSAGNSAGSAGDSAGNAADSAGAALVIKSSIVNVRAGAGTGYSLVSKVKAGDRLTVLKKDGDWYLTSLPDGKQGWVAGWLGELKTSPANSDSDPGQNAKPASPGSQAVPVSKSMLVIKGTAVNVRAGAGTGFAVVSKVEAGQRLKVLKKDGQWYLVRLENGKQGWVAAWLGQLVSETTSRDGTDRPAQTNLPATEPAANPAAESATKPPTEIPPETPTKTPTEPAAPPAEAQPETPAEPQPETPTEPEPGVYPGSGQEQGLPVPVETQPTTQPTTQPETGMSPDSGQDQVPTGPPAKILSVEFKGNGSGEEQLKITSEGEIRYNIISLKAPDRLVIDLQNTDVNNIRDFIAARVLVSNVRVGQYSKDPMVVRVVLDLKKAVSYKPELDESGKIFTLNLTEPSLPGKSIVIDPGHGGYDPGAIGVTGLEEKEFNLDVAQRLRDKLTAMGASVIMTRADDTFVTLSGRAAVANQVYADIFVSVHANSSYSSSKRGTATYFYSPASSPDLYAQLEKRQRLATKVQSRLIPQLGTENLGVPQANFAVLRETTMPSILVESAFLSNAADEALLKDSGFRDREAQAITEGLLDYFAN